MKKIIIIGGAVLVICFITIAALFITQKQPNQQGTVSNTQPVFDFTLTPPQNWVGSFYSYDTGKIFMLKEKNTPDTDATPVFIIEQHSLSDLDKLNQRIKDSLAQGNSSQKITLNSEEVNKVEGPLEYSLVNPRNNTVLKISPSVPVQEAMILYTYKNNAYFIEYKYGGSNKNPQLEQVFKGIVFSIKGQ